MNIHLQERSVVLVKVGRVVIMDETLANTKF